MTKEILTQGEGKSIDVVLGEIGPKARTQVPDHVKQEMIGRIEEFVRQNLGHK